LDAKQFDSLTRAFSRGASRRGVLTGLVATLLATLPLPIGHGETAAKKKVKGKKKKKKGNGCPNGQKECFSVRSFAGGIGGRRCIPQNQCCDDFDCSSFNCANEFCLADGTCGCPPGWTKHNGRCGLFPNCKSTGAVVTSPTECCSGDTIYENNQNLCYPGTSACLADADCLLAPIGGPTGTFCRGFQCVGQITDHDCLP
jgi:hypothetical protein